MSKINEKTALLDDGAKELQEKIRSWNNGKYVPVQMDQIDSETGNANGETAPDLIFITYFKDKIYIGAKEKLTDSQIKVIKDFFVKDIDFRNSSLKILKGSPEIKLEIKHSFVDVAKIAAKVAVNTLAYIAGTDAVLNSRDLDEIIGMILSGNESTLKDDGILGRSRPLRDAEELKRKCYLEKDCQACLLCKTGAKLIAYVFFYNISYAVELSYDSNIDICCVLGLELGLDGIVCDWKNQKDYRYIDYIANLGCSSQELSKEHLS